MIFITVGSQKFQFNRLLREIDKLVNEKIIDEQVFAQIGYSDYKPKSFKYKEFLNRDEFSRIMDECDTVITHGGTGAIIGAIKKRKSVIAVPRLKKFKEHVDDHQLQIIDEFGKMDFINVVNNIEELGRVLTSSKLHKTRQYISNTNVIIKSIDEFINN